MRRRRLLGAAAARVGSLIGNLAINREDHTVTRGERRIDLTVREFALLEYLMNNVGKTVSRATLMRDVWNLPFDPSTNIVDVYMKYAAKIQETAKDTFRYMNFDKMSEYSALAAKVELGADYKTALQKEQDKLRSR